MMGSTKAFAKTLSVLAAAALGLAACSGDSSSSSRSLSYELNSRQFFVEESLGSVQFQGGASLDLSLSIGSSAFRSTDEGNNFFYTLSDRGPTFDCSESQAIIGVANLCGGNAGTVFALPQFAPQIQKWKLSGVGTKLSIEKLETIRISTQNGSDVNGLPNEGSGEVGYDPNGNELGTSANGFDPEALVRLNNGRFWVADEYGPSLVLLESDGRIVRREVPQGRGVDYVAAGYTVSEGFLPGILARRQVDRGISALAVTPDNEFLYFVMEAPLANPSVAAVADSRVVRIVKLALNDDGSIASVDGEYLYRLDTPSQFATKHDGKGALDTGEFVSQSEVRVTEAAAVDVDSLVVVEQARDVSKYYRINLANATSILGSQWDQESTSPSLEEQFLVSDAPFVVKQLGFDSLSMPLPAGIDALGENIEGLALLSSAFVAVVSDNRYGVYDQSSAGARSRISILPLGSFIISSTPPYRPSLDYAESASYQRADAQPDTGAAEIVAVDTTNDQLFVVNAQLGIVEVLDIETPLQPTLLGQLDIAAAATDSGVTLGAINSVAVGTQHVAVAIENSDRQQNGIAALYNLEDLTLAATFEVGAGPDMLTFDLLAQRLLVANEGEPNDDYSIDPEGSVTLIDLTDGVDAAEVTQIGFSEFNAGGARASELPAGVRVFGPGASVAQDLEPEYIGVALNNNKAFVSLQENNAVAVIDFDSKSVSEIFALGTKDFGVKGNELDVNDDGSINFGLWPGVVGMYQPDAIAAYQFAGKNFFVTANEGDARDYSGFSEELRASDLDGVSGPDIDPANPSANAAADDNQLGRLKVSSEAGNTDADNDIEEISAFGARSFAIWDEEGNLVFDSGADLLRVTHALLGNNANDRDTRSDDKGAEPEGLTLIASLGRVYAFIGLERTGGIAVYDVTSPYGVQFVQYVNNRNFAADLQNETGDVGPEGLTGFLKEGVGYIVVGNEVSGNVRIFELDAGNSVSD
ncbi:MAG: choice-of-anchor I family protein [Pseudomonadota bacterium]|nr:choice-of-anchor I family protein [Pseudomonadota bacterium]